MSEVFKTFRELLDRLPPPPVFDRVAVHDTRALHDFKRKPAPLFTDRGTLSPALLGVPVVIDHEVEVGVIELRKGDEVYKRVYLSELRA